MYAKSNVAPRYYGTLRLFIAQGQGTFDANVAPLLQVCRVCAVAQIMDTVHG